VFQIGYWCGPRSQGRATHLGLRSLTKLDFESAGDTKQMDERK